MGEEKTNPKVEKKVVNETTKEVEVRPQVEEKQGSTKKKKIRKLSVEEIDEALKYTESIMGGLGSKYAQHLLRRKDELARGLK